MGRIIEVKGNGGYLSVDRRKAGNQHEANSTKLRITFDPGWDGYAKTVTFWDAKGQNPVKRTLTADLLENVDENTRVYLCPIPGEALAENGMMTFAIDGYVNGVRQRTVGAELEVEWSPYEENAGEAADPTPSQAEQLQAEIEALLGDVQAQTILAEAAAAAADQARIEAERARDASLEIAGGEHVTMKDLAGKADVNHTHTPDSIGAFGQYGSNLHTDLNNFIELGGFICTNTSIANRPAGVSQYGLVWNIRGSTIVNYIVQHYYDAVSKREYVRYRTDNTWGNWAQIATAEYAVNKAGDTMTGNLGILTGSDPSMFAKNSSTGRIARVVSYGDQSVRIENHKDGLNYAGIDIRTEADSLDGIARLVVLKNGVWNPYDILHEGNTHLINPTAIGAARIETGTYVGAGKAGSLYPNSLTFGFEPTVVMLGGYGVPNGVVFFKGMTETSVYANTFSQGIKFALSGTTLAWYNSSAGESESNTTRQMGQLNMLGETYTYVALG